MNWKVFAISIVIVWSAIAMYGRHHAPTTGESRVGTDAPEMHGLGWDSIVVPPTIQTRGGGSRVASRAVKKLINLPSAAVEDDAEVLLNAVKTESHGAQPGITASATLNAATGKSTIYVRDDPLGWTPRVRADGSITIGPALTNNGTAGAIMADVNLLSVNQFTVRAWGIALAPSNAADPVAAVGVGLSYEFDLLRR